LVAAGVIYTKEHATLLTFSVLGTMVEMSQVSLRNTKQELAVLTSLAEENTGPMAIGFWISDTQ